MGRLDSSERRLRHRRHLVLLHRLDDRFKVRGARTFGEEVLWPGRLRGKVDALEACMYLRELQQRPFFLFWSAQPVPGDSVPPFTHILNPA